MTRKDGRKEELPAIAGGAKGAAPEKPIPDSTASQPAPSAMSRRAFIGRASLSTAVAATAVGVPSLLASKARAGQAAGAADIADIISKTETSGVPRDIPHRERSFLIRVRAATEELRVPVPEQVNNLDEVRYPNRIGNYSKGLPHDDIGEVVPDAYDRLLIAIESGDPDDFERIPLGGSAKLADPQEGLAFYLEGTDSGQVTIPPAPALSSPERAGEMVEDYWMALARDIPFSQYGNEPITAAAIAELNNLSDFQGPRVNGQVTARTLFRGSLPGDLIGPYMSQFLLRPLGLGTLPVAQKYTGFEAGTEYQTDFKSWLRCENGQGPFLPQLRASITSYLKDGRDLGAYAKLDFMGQANLTAALWLLQNNAPLNPGNPYLRSANQVGVGTFGNQHLLGLIYEVALIAQKAMWYQKWFVHRTLRPEEFGALVHKTLTGIAKYPLHVDVLSSEAVNRVFTKHNSYLLPAAYSEGCPQHPSYGEAHGVVAGAMVTSLKAFFDESFVLTNPVVASDDGQSLIPYQGSDAGQIVVGGELNKLANNIALGRNMAAVHWRSDATQALLLGERVAISILRDQRRTFNEHFDGFTFTRFDGTTITV
jgi:hypothetical protein